MLDSQQLKYFKTFGFVVMKNVFTSEELNTINQEFKHRAEVASEYKEFDGSVRHNLRMMSNDTPFFASLLEDTRFAKAAEQMFGKVIGYNIDADRYTGDTVWHYDAGGYEDIGVKFAFYLQPVGAETGALRVIPGSHKKELFDELEKYEPIGPKWTRNAATPEEKQLAIEHIGNMPSYICESKPGDVVAFDLRTYHSSLGGSNDRHMCSVVYHKDPETPEEYEIMTVNIQGHLAHKDQSSEPWNPPSLDPDWIANVPKNKNRQKWINRMFEINKLKTGLNGLNVIAENGKMKVIRSS